ncbi:MAG: DUF1653 domain-containing protein [Solobacterium sp.]|nr:DUF1653 domain-containing protein [Solobacterium sp.]
MIEKGSIYQHYKGNIYRILGVGKHSETLEEYVIYEDVQKGLIWVRPYNMFLEDVQLKDGTIVPRFKRIHTENEK